MSIGSKVTIIDVSEWDGLVKSVYGRPYDFQQQDGCQDRKTVRLTIPDEAYDYENKSIPYVINGNEMGVSFKAWLEQEPTTYRDIFWERNFYPDLQTVANDLYNNGILEAGEYGINIDW